MRTTHPMHSIAILAALAFAPIAGAHEAGARGEEGSAPKAVLDRSVVDAGEVPVGQEIEAAFEIRNEGTAPLEIEDVRSSCGCTVAEYDDVIAPGEVGTVRATVDTTDLMGPNSKAIVVLTNDPDSPRLKLAVESDVRSFLGIDPGYARFNSFVRHERDQSSAQLLMAPEFEDLEVLAVETPHPWIQVEFREAEERERSDEASGTQWRIDVTLAAEAPVGPVGAHVVVRTNHPKQKSVAIPVSGFVRPKVAVTPPNVNFGKIDPEEEQKEWAILVRNFGSAPLWIDDVRSDVAGLRVEVEPIEEGKQYKLVFTPTPELVEGLFDGTVSVATNLPEQPTITVEVKGERI